MRTIGGVVLASSLVPPKHPERAQRVPPAGQSIAGLEREVDRAGMCVLQKPRAIGLPFGSQQIDRFLHSGVRRIPDGPEVLQRAEHIVMPSCRKRELQKGWIDDFASGLAPEQFPFE
jgi:hypothetical protein